jgi:hypothetical protein
MRIFPEMWANTLWPFSNSTRNIAFGSDSTIVPSRTIASSFGFGSVFSLQESGYDSGCSDCNWKVVRIDGDDRTTISTLGYCWCCTAGTDNRTWGQADS